MRSILVHCQPGPAGAAQLQTALSLARMTSGHVTALVATPVNHYATVDGLGGSVVAIDAMREAIAADDAFAAEVKARLGRDDVPFSVIRAESEPFDALVDAARLADAVVVSRDDRLAGDLALAVRCAVIALGDDHALTFPLGSALVAWDGSSESCAALRASLPLLAGCSQVAVVTVADKAPVWPATGALAYLSRHGIAAELESLERVGAVEDVLAAELALRGSDVLVMGAFGHSRVREYLFGGVTRALLERRGSFALSLSH